MNKLFTKIAALALGAAMVVGVGVSVGSKSQATTAEAAATDGTECVLWTSSNGYTASDDESTSSDGAIKWYNSAGNNYSKPTRIYANNTFTIEIADSTKASSINGIVIETNSDKPTADTTNASWTATGSSASVSASASGSTVTGTTSGTVTKVTIKPSAQVRWDSVTVYYAPAGGGGGGGGDTPTDTYGLDGKNIIIKSNNNCYIPSTIGTSGKPSATTAQSDSAIFLFSLVDSDTFTLKLTNGDNKDKYLKTGTGTGGSSTINMGTTAEKWEVETYQGNKYLKDEDGHYLSVNSTTDWRMYNPASGGTPTTTGSPKMTFIEASTDPRVTSVTMSGSPSASASVVGGTSWKMSATVTVENDPDSTLSRNINWTVAPSGAVTFSSATSASGAEITVTAVNTARTGVVITASSAATGFTSVHADSNTFSIVKSYVVNTNTVVTSDGESIYDGNGESSKQVTFVSTLTYSGEAGTYAVGLAVEPSAGVTLSSSSITSSSSGVNFTATFTKIGTYTITATPVENPAKADSVQIEIKNVVTPGYELINSNEGLVANKGRYIIYGYNGSSSPVYSALLGEYKSNTYYSCLSYTANDGFISESDAADATVFQLETATGGYYIKDLTTNLYLRHDGTTSSANKILQTENTADSYTIWTITFDGDVAHISLKDLPTREIQLNATDSSGRFATYTGTQKPVYLYKMVDNSPRYTINETSAYLGVRGTIELSLTEINKPKATIEWSFTDDNVDEDVVSIDGSGLNVNVTALALGNAVVKAHFIPLDGNTYDDLICAISVIPLDMYVNVGVTEFTKQSSTPTGGWDGTYLIVDETTSTMLDGSKSITRNSYTSVTIDDSGSVNKVLASNSILTQCFNIKASTNGYYVKSNSNYYIGNVDASKNGIYSSVVTQYETLISSSGQINAYIDGADSGQTLRHFVSTDQNYYAFTKSGGNTLSLYKANGDVRAITDTITAWYDNAKENEYLVCDMGGKTSKINWDALSSGSFYTALTSTDKDTLKRMSVKAGEDNGNYLEDFISDYDFLVREKHYDDFLERFKTGGANAGQLINDGRLFGIENTGTTIIIIVSVIGVSALGGFFFLRKRKEI